MSRQPQKLGRSFVCAAKGICHCVVHERNMRIHLAVAAYVFYFSRYYALSEVQFAVLLLTVALVLCAELINTAVEAAVDLCSPQRHPLARIAKDVAAGAVLLCALFSVGVGVALFGDWKMICHIAGEITGSWKYLLFLLASLFFAGGWVFIGPSGVARWFRRHIKRKV